MPVVAVCIPTFKRPHLLKLLIDDISKQTMKPNHIIVVDGDPNSSQVRQILMNGGSCIIATIYVPSNHGNLPYQRYLGWRVAKDLEVDIIIYFDDDERLLESDVIAQLVATFNTSSDVVGVGCRIRFGHATDGSDASQARSQKSSPSIALLIKYFGSSRRLHPGSVTPTGNRVSLIDDGTPHAVTSWLHGGAMAYRMSAMSETVFSDDLFALDHVRCGLGEDTFLSRRVGARGILKYIHIVSVSHPNADSPKSYPSDAFRFAYAATYSRRFQNDYYRVYDPPQFSDRVALLRSYIAGILISWMRALRFPSRLHWALACGTMLGAVQGFTRPPTARCLTPDINWWLDADEALNRIEFM